MQAGEKINFIRSLSEFTPDSPEHTHPEILDLYLKMCRELVTKYRRYVESFSLPLLAQSDSTVSSELALQIKANDGSYIHIVINWMSDSVDNLNETSLKLRIAEHDPEGVYLNGFVYDIVDNALVRSDVPAIAGQELKRNFSRVVAHAELNELLELGQSEWESDRELAKVHLELIDGILESKSMDKEFGFNEVPIELDELQKISILLREAVAYDIYI